MIYKIGSRGGDVLKIQEAVGVSADGLYGARTKEAVAVWQKALANKTNVSLAKAE